MASQLIRFQLANRPQRWSWRSVLEKVKRQSRLLYEKLIKRYPNGHDTELVTRVPLYRSPNETEYLKSFERQFGLFRSGFFRKASKWSRDSLASALTKKSGHRVFRGASGATVSFVGFVLATKPSILTEEEELDGLSYEIREAFSKVPVDARIPAKYSGLTNVSLKDLEIGDLLAKGCNAVVYSASIKEDNDENGSINQNDLPGIASSDENSEVPEEWDTNYVQLQKQDLSQFDLAVKVMFNYNAQSEASIIWRSMFKEALPAIHGLPYPRAKHKQIPPHPNIVEMYSAFADEMPLLPDALSHYPQALPLRLAKQGFGRNMTLFLIMKRYHCSLKEYLTTYSPSTRTSMLLFCQLLEGLVHLQQFGFAHRDLKTDNILLDLSDGVDKPIVAITDFGCCLEGLKLPFTSEEVDRGGNLALMAPEVCNAEAGPFSMIDYWRSDLWTLGSIAYEIFGAKNPFYMSDEAHLEAANYSEVDLPPLPRSTPKIIQTLIQDMLQRDPQKRPTPSLAATVCQLLLQAPPKLLQNPLDKRNNKELAQWLSLLSIQTFLKSVTKSKDVQSLEHQLRYCFFRRIQFSELFEALKYMA